MKIQTGPWKQTSSEFRASVTFAAGSSPLLSPKSIMAAASQEAGERRELTCLGSGHWKGLSLCETLISTYFFELGKAEFHMLVDTEIIIISSIL